MHAFQSLVQDALKLAKEQDPRAWVFGTPDEVHFFQACSRQDCKPSKPPVQVAAKPISPVPTPVPIHRPPAAKQVQDAPAPKIHTSQPVESKEAVAAAPKAQTDRPSEEMWKILKKIVPNISLSDQAPDDQIAKQVASAWKEKLPDTDVVLLVLNTLPDTVELMKNLAKAIQKDLGTVKLMTGDRLEQEKRWDLFFQKNTFRLILASPGIQQYPELLKHYRMLPAQQTAFLGNIPLVVLEPASSYKDSADKKLSLWKTLCLMLKR